MPGEGSPRGIAGPGGVFFAPLQRIVLWPLMIS